VMSHRNDLTRVIDEARRDRNTSVRCALSRLFDRKLHVLCVAFHVALLAYLLNAAGKCLLFSLHYKSLISLTPKDERLVLICIAYPARRDRLREIKLSPVAKYELDAPRRIRHLPHFSRIVILVTSLVVLSLNCFLCVAQVRSRRDERSPCRYLLS